jgi:hypothetical protein
VPDDVRDRVLACNDSDVLERWLRQAVIVSSPEQLFDHDE